MFPYIYNLGFPGISIKICCSFNIEPDCLIVFVHINIGQKLFEVICGNMGICKVFMAVVTREISKFYLGKRKDQHSPQDQLWMEQRWTQLNNNNNNGQNGISDENLCLLTPGTSLVNEAPYATQILAYPKILYLGFGHFDWLPFFGH